MTIRIHAFLLVATLLVACDGDDGGGSSLIDAQIQKLTGSWHVTSVKADDVARGDFEDFILSITPLASHQKLSYVITENPYVTPWPSTATGHFTFYAAQPDKFLVREDDVLVEYAVSETALTMRFTYQGDEGGRIAGVGGEWEFVFEKHAP